MHWIEIAHQRPAITAMGQTDHVLVAYYPQPNSDLQVAIAFYDQDARDSGWLQSGTFTPLRAPRYWMPLPAVPSAR